jgi:hypothetical protein
MLQLQTGWDWVKQKAKKDAREFQPHPHKVSEVVNWLKPEYGTATASA